MKSGFSSTISREICADVCYKAVRGILTLNEERVYISVFMQNLEKFQRKISIQTIFAQRDFFFFKLKQFIRTCSSIVRIYFQTILLLDKKFLKESILITKTFEFSIKFFLRFYNFFNKRQRRNSYIYLKKY